MALMTQMINMKALLASQQDAISAKVEEKAVETQGYISQSNTETKGLLSETKDLVLAENNETQHALESLVTVNGEIDTNVQAVNAHVTYHVASARTVITNDAQQNLSVIRADISALENSVSAIDGDIFTIKAPVLNVLDSSARPNGITGFAQLGDTDIVLSRTGSGYICFCTVEKRVNIEFIVDGVMAYQRDALNGVSKIVGGGAALNYIPYKSSIVVRVSATQSDYNDYELAHVMTG